MVKKRKPDDISLREILFNATQNCHWGKVHLILATVLKSNVKHVFLGRKVTNKESDRSKMSFYSRYLYLAAKTTNSHWILSFNTSTQDWVFWSNTSKVYKIIDCNSYYEFSIGMYDKPCFLEQKL